MPTVIDQSVTEAFQAAIAERCGHAPEKIIADGKIHRFSTNGKANDDSGWYVLYLDGRAAGAFGCWRTGVQETWCAGKPETKMTATERAAHAKRIAEFREIRQYEEDRQHADARKRALAILDKATPVQEGHPYLMRKQIAFDQVRYWLKVDAHNNLLVPVEAPGADLYSLQYIAPNGDKRFLRGGRVKGGFHLIYGKGNTNITLLCEGFVTGCSVNQATGLEVLVTFTESNLLTVARDLREQDLTGTIVICADNDFHADGKPNTGLLAATAAAKAINGILAVPPVLDNSPTDWNDVHVKQGLEAVKQAIESVLPRTDPTPPDPGDTMNGDTGLETEHTATDPLNEAAPPPQADLGEDPNDETDPVTDKPFQESASCGSGGPGGPSGPDVSQEQENSADHQKNESGPKRSTGPADATFQKVEGYRIDENGVFELDKTEIRLTLKPCEVLAYCRDGMAQNWGAFLRWQDRDGQAHEAAFPVGRFHEPGSGIPVDLAGLGLPIVPGMERRLLRYLASCAPATRYRVAIQTGWSGAGSVFVLPSCTLGETSSNERIVYQPERYAPTSGSMKTGGTLKGWQAEVAARCAGNPILTFWLSASFAAPLLRPLQLEGGGCHLHGLTSRGKTTAEQIAASVWGDGSDPAEGRATAYVRKWNITKNATEGLAEAFNDLPLCLDEVGEADAHEFARIIYQLAGGQGKGRMRADATLKQAKVWRTLLLSTGELPASDVIQSEGRRLKGGQVVRLVDIPATDPVSGEGIIESLHGSESPAHFADTLKRACAEHYGHAGPAFIEALIHEGLSSVRAELGAALRELVAAFTPKGASPELQRIVKRVAVVGLAGAKAADLSILPWSKTEAIHAAKMVLARLCAAREGADGDIDRAIEQVKDFILKHGGSRFRDLANSTEKVYDLLGYRDALSGTFYFTPEAFKEACDGHDVRAVARELKSRGHLRTPDDGHLTERVTVEGFGRVRLYAVSAKMLDGEPVKAA